MARQKTVDAMKTSSRATIAQSSTQVKVQMKAAAKGEESYFLVSRKTGARHSVWEALGFLLPHNLMHEIEKFKRDNALIVSSVNGRLDMQCCKCCLKAHALKKAMDMGLDSATITYIEQVFPGKVGHEGYYVNNGEMIHVNDIH